MFLLFVLSLFSLLYCSVKQTCWILSSGDRSQKLENKIERISQEALLCWVHLFHTAKVKNSLSKISELVLLNTESFYTHIPRSFVERGGHASCSCSVLSGMTFRYCPTRYHLLLASSSLPQEFLYYPSPFTHMVRKKQSLNTAFCNGQNSIYLQQMLSSVK